MTPTALPIDPFLDQIVNALKSLPNLVLKAEPGAGKTTRVPLALLEAGLAGDKQILVLQPRRLAARLAARRVAQELGTREEGGTKGGKDRLGELVGYQVRFEEVSGPKTRLFFVTEGVLTRKLLSRPNLDQVGLVVLDEFHERHLDGDLCLALLRKLQRTRRPDLKLVVMSATLDPEPISQYLGNSSVLKIPGRCFEVTVEHISQTDTRPLELQVASAVKRTLDSGLEGDLLIFLPGASEIRKAGDACDPIARRAGLLAMPLHGELPVAEQDKAVSASDRRKIILSTNIAETSVTIEGVVAVIDSGVARVAGHSSWSGMSSLRLARISKASAIQRAGRAGRIRPGRCLRLYTQLDFSTRPEMEQPEILRLDLADTALAIRGIGLKGFDELEWLEAPPVSSVKAAELLLRRLEAIDANGQITGLGKKMLQFPLHPRQARILLEAQARGYAEDGCLLAALLGERELRMDARAAGFGWRSKQARICAPSDLLESFDAFREAEKAGFDHALMRRMELDIGTVHSVDRSRRNLERLALRSACDRSIDRSSGEGDSGARNLASSRLKGGSSSISGQDEPLLMAILAGFPDRVARRRGLEGTLGNQRNARASGGSSEDELLLCGGGSAKLSEKSVVREAQFMVAIDAEERSGGGKAGTLVRSASRIEPEWLLDLFSDQIREVSEVVWNSAAERVDGFSRLLYGELVIEESRSSLDRARTKELLACQALAKGFRTFAEEGAIDRLQERIALAAGLFPELGFSRLAQQDVERALKGLCEDRRSFAELMDGSLMESILAILSPSQRAALDRLLPERICLPSGRRVQVGYEPGKPVWIESRLQDFFGMMNAPQIAEGRIKLVIHLLAPNRLPVQVTSDLAGFWERHYPAIRRELCRKYPKHAWPENPKNASPPIAGIRNSSRDR